MTPPTRRRAVHGVNAVGRLACNPRDREAALRAEVADIKTGDLAAITCLRCLAALRREQRDRRAGG